MRLQFMDERGGALMDLNWDETDPGLHARQAIAATILQPAKMGPLKTLFFHFEPDGWSILDAMISYARQLLLSIDSQVDGIACTYVRLYV